MGSKEEKIKERRQFNSIAAGVSVIMDFIGAPYWNDNMVCTEEGEKEGGKEGEREREGKRKRGIERDANSWKEEFGDRRNYDHTRRDGRIQSE
jgi:hypothetical protein